MGVLDLIEGRRRRREEQRRLKLEQRRLKLEQRRLDQFAASLTTIRRSRAPVELRNWVVATARDGSFYQAVDLLVMKVCIERISHSTLVEAWRLTSPHGIEMVESHWDATWVFQRALDRLNRTPPPHFGAIVKPWDAAD